MQMALLIPLFVSLLLFFSIMPAYSAVFNIPSGNVTSLMAAINAANANGEENTIILEDGIYTLTASGLPLITSALTITGAGADFASIVREASAPAFRIIAVSAAGTLTMEGLTLQGGSLPGFGMNPGGGSLFNEGTVIITGNSISGDSIGPGGAIRNRGTMTISDSVVSGRSSPLGGGGGISNSGNLVISNSSISGTVVDGSGGGISNSGTLHITSSTISGLADGGGGISSGGTLTLTNSTVTQSLHAGFAGGGAGMWIHGGQVAILNSTIADNVSHRVGPAGIWVGSGTVTLQNTILARNIGGLIESPELPDDCIGELTSLGNNIIGDPTGCTITLQPTDQTGEPGLGTFVYLGTPGSGHIPLLTGSPAIDTGNNDVCVNDPVLATDQIGAPRNGACDIGAIEFQPPILTIAVDIRTGSRNNNINPKSNSKIPIAILSTNIFDARTVDPASLRFGPNQGLAKGTGHFRDVNHDGFRDLVLQFRVRDAGIQCGDTSVSITGQTADRIPIQGTDSIRTVGCKPQTGKNK
jgi:hypothetical protein